MRRRDFLQLGGSAAVAWSMPALAQQTSSLSLVAVLVPGSLEQARERVTAIRKGLQEAGLAEDLHYTIALRYAEGRMDRLPSLASELEAMKPAVYVAGGSLRGVRSLQTTTPVVFTAIAADPVAAGIADSWVKPGGRFTGNVMNAQGGEVSIAEKRIVHFKELVPNLTRLGMIGPTTGNIQLFEQENSAARRAGARLGFEVTQCGIATIDDLEGVISSGLRNGVDAFYISGEAIMFNNMPRVMPLVMAAARPTVAPYVEFCRAGVLMTYATDSLDGYRRAGVYAAKILQGANAGDLPIEQASKYTLAVNTKTAKLLGITIPTAVLALADEVVE